MNEYADLAIKIGLFYLCLYLTIITLVLMVWMFHKLSVTMRELPGDCECRHKRCNHDNGKGECAVRACECIHYVRAIDDDVEVRELRKMMRTK